MRPSAALVALVEEGDEQAHGKDEDHLDGEVAELAGATVPPEDVRRKDEWDRREAGEDDGGDAGPEAEHDARVGDDEEEFGFVQGMETEVG